jgi:nucleoside-diphosphate-sugar epimerase
VRVLITGVAGFIGSNLAMSHLKDGNQVTGVDNFSTGTTRNMEALDKIDFINSDLLESRALLPKSVDLIYHFASPASPEKYMAQPINTMDVNTVGTRLLLEYSLEIGARIVFASTSEIYGDPLDRKSACRERVLLAV